MSATQKTMSHTNEDISIWDAKNRLTYSEPLTPDDPLFIDATPARGDFSLKRLYRELNIDNQGIAHTPPRQQYILLTGHRGCGKSTELLHASSFLHHPDRYYVIHLDCLKKLNLNNLRFPDILLALTAALLKKLDQDKKLTLDQTSLSPLERWVKKKIKEDSILQGFAEEIAQEVKMQTRLPWLSSIVEKLTDTINNDSNYRETLRLSIRNSLTEFTEAINQLIFAGEKASRDARQGQRIAFTVDGTDRLNQQDVRQLFINDAKLLTQVHSLFIYCVPIHLIQKELPLAPNFSHPFRLPMIEIRNQDGEEITENIGVMRELALRRVPEQFFDEQETLDYLIRYSGGHPRDMLRLLNAAINCADEECIDQAAAKKAVKQVANEYRRLINESDYSRLVQIDLHPDAPDDFTDSQSNELLSSLALLEYSDYFWKSHPLITSLPGYEKAFQMTR